MSMLESAKNYVEYYNSNGFVVVPGLISNELRSRVFKTVAALTIEYFGRFTDIPSALSDKLSWDSEDFQNFFVSNSFKYPDGWQAIYDACKIAGTVQELFLDPAVANFAAQLLQGEIVNLSVSSHIIKMDLPKATKKLGGWHRECCFSGLSYPGNNGVVCWLPFTNVDENSGTMRVIPTSHLDQIGKNSEEDLKNSLLYVIADELVPQKQWQDLVLKSGDALFFNMKLIHRILENYATSAKFTARGRFHLMNKADFIPHSPVYQPNDVIKQSVFNSRK